MKKILLALIVITCLSTGKVQGQDASQQDSIEVGFAIAVPEDNSLTFDQRKEIKVKLEAILARTLSSSAVNKTPFVIVPELNNVTTESTAGGKQTSILIEGELTLIVKNRYDGTSYNEVIVPLKEVVEASRVNDPKIILIRSINVKDRRFVRFIKNSQNRIVEYYENKSIVIP